MRDVDYHLRQVHSLSPLFEEKWLNFFIGKKEELENFHCVTFFWACTRTSCWEEAEASFCQKCFVSSWRQRRREDSRLLCHRTEKKVKSTSFLKLCKTQKRYYIYLYYDSCKKCQPFYFSRIAYYVCTIRGNSSQMTRKDKIDDFNLYKPYWPFKGVKILKKLAT